MEPELYYKNLQDKYCRPLSAGDLFLAFPDCKDMATTAIKRLKKSVLFWRNHLSESLQGVEPKTTEYILLSGIIKGRMKRDNNIALYNMYDKYILLCNTVGKNTMNIDVARATPIETLFTMVKPRSSGGRISCCCPLHNDKTPSFVIYKKNNTFHCFGCHQSGDSISFMQKLHNVDFKTAVKMLGGYNGN